MIIAFDGNVFAGKTTLINYLTDKIDCWSVAEHTFFINKIKKGGGYSPVFNEHLRYLYVDRLRIKMINKGVSLIDRSFVSLSAHAYALYFSSGVDLREKHLEILRSFLQQKKIIIPNLYVFVSCEMGIAKKRLLTVHNEPNMFIEKKYFFAVEKFNLLWQKGLSKSCIVGPSKTSHHQLTETITESVKKKIEKMSPADIIGLTEKIFFNNY